jgi:hypothetical protein
MRSDIMAMCWLRLSASARPRRARAVRPCLERLDARWVPAVVDPTVIPTAVISITPHVWTPDPTTGLYHTATNLLNEWQADYQAALHGASLTPEQHAEANAWEVFQATSLRTYPEAQQEAFAEDFQREADAIYAAMQQTPGVDPSQHLTETTYLAVENTLQNDPTLLELAVQGHGLNDPPATRYYGYTNDFQNNTDNSTYYVGGGLDNNETAVPNLFDDAVITHVPFATVYFNGTAWQLNQNGDPEDPLDQTVIGMDDIWYGRVLTSADFSTQPSSANDGYVSPFTSLVGSITTLYGPASTTVTIGSHVWSADPVTGLYTTPADLAAEWQAAGQAVTQGTATPLQYLEANAERILENTGVSGLSSTQQAAFREDVQRVLDAVDAAISDLGTSFPLTSGPTGTYLQVQEKIANNPTLEELATQGYGLANPRAARYSGYINDFRSIVGDGIDDSWLAANQVLTHNVTTQIAFPVVWRDGQLVQLDYNAGYESTLDNAVAAVNQGASTLVPIGVTFEFGNIEVASQLANGNTAEVSLDPQKPGQVKVTVNGASEDFPASSVFNVTYIGSPGGGDAFVDTYDAPLLAYGHGGNNNFTGNASWNYIFFSGNDNTYFDRDGGLTDVFENGGTGDTVNSNGTVQVYPRPLIMVRGGDKGTGVV